VPNPLIELLDDLISADWPSGSPKLIWMAQAGRTEDPEAWSATAAFRL